jgi:hypothetical protein
MHFVSALSRSALGRLEWFLYARRAFLKGLQMDVALPMPGQ